MMGEQPGSPIEKKVDESWKARADNDRRSQNKGGGIHAVPPSSSPSSSGENRQETPVTDFGFFLSTLSMQVLVALGEVPHPGTGRPEQDLEQARTLIDVLGMLKEKTKGNLTSEESEMLEGILYELRMKYVSKVKP